MEKSSVREKINLLKTIFKDALNDKQPNVVKGYYRINKINPCDGISFFLSFRVDYGYGKRLICSVTINLENANWNTLFSIHVLEDRYKRYSRPIFRKRTRIVNRGLINICEEVIIPTLAEKLNKIENEL